MTRTFTDSSEARCEQVPWGTLAWFSSPDSTGTKNLVVVEVRFDPDRGHNFHKHPNQEEVIYVLEGEIEQWVGTEKRRLRAGCGFRKLWHTKFRNWAMRLTPATTICCG